MKMKYEPKNTGYITLLRNFQKLLLNDKASFSVLGAFICFVFQADWDKRHKNYRAILSTDTELSRFWNLDNSTVIRSRKKLIELGYLEEKDGNTYIKNLELFEIKMIKLVVKSKVENLHEYYAKSENDLAKKLMNIEETQEFQV